MVKIIAANWKMNNDFSDIKPFVKYVKKNVKEKNGLVVCVPSVMLKETADASKKVFEVGAENCYFAEKGAYTGEISAKMVKSAGRTPPSAPSRCPSRQNARHQGAFPCRHRRCRCA